MDKIFTVVTGCILSILFIHVKALWLRHIYLRAPRNYLRKGLTDLRTQCIYLREGCAELRKVRTELRAERRVLRERLRKDYSQGWTG